jgi:hypothetical protein
MVNEIRLAKPAVGFSAGRHTLGYERRYTSLLAFTDFFTAEITPIGNDVKLRHAQRGFSLLSHMTGYYRLLQVITGYYRLLQVITGYYRLLQVITGYYRLLQVITGIGN